MATTAVTSSTSSTSTTNTSSTSSTSGSNSTTSASSSAKAAASNIVKTLGAGSGIDINSLAQSLVEAEQAPQRDRINAKITQTQSRITGYNAMKYALADLKTAFSALNDASDFNSINSSNSQPSAFSVSTTSAATTGAYDVSVSSIAAGQRSVASFSATDTSLSDTDFNLSVTVGSTTKTVSVTNHTPAGVVSAINGSADFKALGLSAQLIDTGVVGSNRYKLVVSGNTGTVNAFSLSGATVPPPSASPLALATVTSAADATVSSPAKSQVSEASFASSGTSLSATDIQLDLTVGSTTKTVLVTTHTPAGVVSAINGSADFQALGVTAQLVDSGTAGPNRYTLRVTGSPGVANAFTLTSTAVPPITFSSLQSATNAVVTVNGVQVTRSTNTIDDVVSGVTFNLNSTTSGTARLGLTRDTSAVKTKVKDLVASYNTFVDSMNVLADSKSKIDTYGGVLAGDSLLRSVREQLRTTLITDSSSPGSNIKAMRDLGVMFDRNGKLQITESKLDAALSNHFDEVTTMFSANAENQSMYSADAGGLAGDMVKKLDGMLRSTGLLAVQTKSAEDKVTHYNDDLTKLQDKMQKLLENYMKQFSAMESIIGESNSLKTSLQSTFDGMMAAYTKG